MDSSTNYVSKKKLWETPEGISVLVLGAGAVSLLIYGWGSILPFLIMTMQNTLYFFGLCVAVAFLIFLLTNKQIRNMAWNLYRIGMRALIGLVIAIDPIGILKNKIESMEDDEAKLNEKRGVLQGAIEKLWRRIEEFKEQVSHHLSLAKAAMTKEAEAAQTAEAAKARGDQMAYQQASLERTRWQQEAKAKAAKAGSLKELAEKKFIPLHGKMMAMDLMLGKAAMAVHYTIENTRNEVETREIEYKTIKTSYSALASAMSAINGNPDERATYEEALAYIEEDMTRKMGAMRQMMEVTSQVVNNMDLENEVAMDKGMVLLDQFMAGNEVNVLVDPTTLPQGASTAQGSLSDGLGGISQRQIGLNASAPVGSDQGNSDKTKWD